MAQLDVCRDLAAMLVQAMHNYGGEAIASAS
jgi:hypothetical protein